MAQRQRAQRQVTSVVPDYSEANVIKSLSTIAGTVQKMQEKKDVARMNDYMADSQIQMLEITNKWRVENEENPNDPKAIQKLDQQYDKVLTQYNNKISGLSRDQWYEVSDKLKNQAKLQNAQWGLKQELVNAENNVNDSIKKNLELGRNMGFSGDIKSALQTYKNSVEGIRSFSDGVFSQQKISKILEDYESDFMESFIGGMIETDPEGALNLLKRDDVKDSLNSKEREETLKDLSDKRKTEIDFDIEKKKIQTENETNDFLSNPEITSAEKFGRLSKLENDEEVSPEYAKLGKLYLKSKATIKPKTNTPEETELIRLAAFMKSRVSKNPTLKESRQFLRMYDDFNKKTLKYMGKGQVSESSAKTIIKGLNTKLAQATTEVATQAGTIWDGFDEEDADNHFKQNLNNQLYRNEALREYFYATDGKNLNEEKRRNIAAAIVKKIEDNILGEGLKEFKTTQEADKSGLAKGTIVLIGGRRYQI